MAEIHYHIDEPRDWERLPRSFLLRGWCFASSHGPIRGLRLRIQDLCIYGAIGKSRPDVKSAFPDAPDNFTGFEVQAVFPSGRQNLAIEVRLDDGSWQLLLSHQAMITRRSWPFWLGGGNWAELIFSQFPCQMQHPPRELTPEKFPSPDSKPARWPKFSVITPSLQQAPFLGETMRGVLKQTSVNCEYVIKDGGSTDGSLDLIRKLDQEWRESPDASEGQNGERDSHRSPSTTPRLISWASEPDAGQADAIARGFTKTSGGPDDVMAWINSDDFYLPGAFAFVADFFASHPTVDVIYGHRLLVDESSREIGRWFLPKHDDEVLRLYDFVPQETMFWRRRIWNKVVGIDSSCHFAMDWDLLLRFQAAGANIVRVPYFLACFRLHPTQKTAAAMDTIGQQEIDALRLRTHQRHIPPAEIEAHPKLLSHLRRSSWIRFLWRLGIRAG